MQAKDLLVPARYYMRLGEVLQKHNIDMRDCLRTLKLPQQALEEPDAMLRFSQVEALIAEVVQVSGRGDLGFELGKLLTVSTHSFVGFGMLNSPDVYSALQFVSRYFRLVMPSFRLRHSTGPDYCELHFTPTLAMGHQCLSFHLEAISTAALRDVQDLAGDRRPPCRLDLSIPEPLHVRRYAELRDVKCSFAGDRTPGARLRFSGDLRAFPVAMADTNALKVAEERCRALVQQVTGVRQFADWVEMTLREVSDGLPTLAELAAMLNLSTRTLNRYLEREGTSFRELAGRVQHELACERLATSALSITEIAYSLGFRDTANFTRAFRSRADCSPRDYRDRARSQPATIADAARSPGEPVPLS